MKPAQTGQAEYVARVRAIPSARVLATVRGVSRGASPTRPAGDDAALVPFVRITPAAGRTAPRGRWRQEVFALLVLFAGVGVSPNLVPDVRRGSGRQTAGVYRRGLSAYSRRGL